LLDGVSVFATAERRGTRVAGGARSADGVPHCGIERRGRSAPPIANGLFDHAPAQGWLRGVDENAADSVDVDA
jgi:hypothetical protein